MALNDVSLFEVLKTKLKWHQKRQTVLAQNVANADTPNYRASDLAKFEIAVPGVAGSALAMQQTSAKHMGIGSGSGRHGQNTIEERADTSFEVRPSRNAVSVDEQMAKMSDNAMGYHETAALMKRVVNMYKTATSKGR